MWTRTVWLQGLDSSFSIMQAIVAPTADLHCSPSSHRCNLMRRLTLCWQEEPEQWGMCICLAASSSKRFCFWTFSLLLRCPNDADRILLKCRPKQKGKNKPVTSWAVSGRCRSSATMVSEDVWKDSGTAIWIQWFIHHSSWNGTRFLWMASHVIEFRPVWLSSLMNWLPSQGLWQHFKRGSLQPHKSFLHKWIDLGEESLPLGATSWFGQRFRGEHVLTVTDVSSDTLHVPNPSWQFAQMKPWSSEH